MDFIQVKRILIEYYKELKRKNISVDLIILFGSYAKGIPHKDSDIDVAVISRSFGKDRFKEGLRVNRAAHSVDARIEAIPISLKEYFDPHSISPILHEIKKTGVLIL